MRREASGRFVLRLPPLLHERLRRTAAEQQVSLNALCTRLLARVAVQAGIDNAAEAAVIETPWRALVHRHAARSGATVLGALLFGSAARGELRAGSDIDLLIVLAAEAALHRRLYRDWDELVADDGPGRELNAHFVHLPERVERAGSLWLEAAVEGRLLDDASGRVQGFLVALRRAIAAGRFTRGMVHGQPYWRRAA